MFKFIKECEKNKMMKGSILDLGFLSIAVLGIVFSLLIGLTIYNSFYTNTTQMISSDGELNQTKYDLSTQLGTINSRMQFNFVFFDRVIFIIFIMLYFSTLHFASNLNTHPIYFVSSIFGLMFVTITAWVIQQMYVTATGLSELVSASTTLEYSGLILNNLPKIIVLFFVILAVVMYSNIKGGVRAENIY